MNEKDLGIEGVYLVDLPHEAYRGRAVTRLDIDVDESLVDERLRDLLEKVSWRDLGAEPIEIGDVLVLSYDGTVASERIGPVEVRMRVGSGEFIPAFEEKLIGRTVGDELLLTLTLPQTHLVEAWEGAEAEVDVRIRSGSRSDGYELTDNHIQAVSDFDSVDELKDAIRAQFEEESAQEEQRLMMSRLAETIGKEVKERLSDEELLAFALASPGHEQQAEDALADEERQALIDEAAFEVAWRNIARLEGIEGEEEADDALASLIESADLDEEAASAARVRMRDGIVCDKVMELILDAAQVECVSEEGGL